MPWSHTWSAQPAHEALDLVGPGVGGQVDVDIGAGEVTVEEGIADGAPDEVGPVTRRREPLAELARGRTRFVEVDEAGGKVHDGPIVSAGTRPRRAQMPISG